MNPMPEASAANAAVRGYGRLYADLYGRFRPETRRTGSERLSMVRVRQRSHATSDPAIDAIVLRLVMHAAPGKGPASRVDFGNGPVRLTGRAGSFYVAPHGAVADWQTAGAHEIMLLALPPSLLRDRLGGGAGMPDLEPVLGREFADPLFADLMSRVWMAAHEHGPAERLMADGFVLAVVGALMAAAGRHAGDDMTGALDDARLTRVRDHIEAYLDGDLAVEALAATACLSP